MKNRKARHGRTFRTAVAISVSVAMLLSMSPFSAVSAAEFTDDAGVEPAETYVRYDLGEYQVNAFADKGAPERSEVGGIATPYGDDSARTFASFNPPSTSPLYDPDNVLSMSSTKAGSDITVGFAGKNQPVFFESCNIVDSNYPYSDPNRIPPTGTIAFIPTDYSDSLGHTADYYSYYDYISRNDYDFKGPPFTYSGAFNKAGAMNITISYQKWTVVDDAPTTEGAILGHHWEPDMTTKYTQTFDQNLRGVIYYYEHNMERGGKTFKTKWVKDGAVYPKVTPKRKGFKFNGWYTNWPGGSKVNVGKTKIKFGNGYSKTLYVHWKKKIKFTFNPNKGKITKGQKSFSVWYLKNVPKAATAKRSGYYWLGWYNKQKFSAPVNGHRYYYNFYKKGGINNFGKATVKYSAQWIKTSKKNTITASEFNKIVNAWDQGLKFVVTRKAAKAAIGGGGMFVDRGTYSGISAERYEWSGNVDGSYVRIVFATGGNKNNDILQISRYGTLK
jgi:hypothetical protein